MGIVGQRPPFGPHLARKLVLGRRVIKLGRAGHWVELQGGDRLSYSKLLLATGASPRRLRGPAAVPAPTKVRCQDGKVEVRLTIR